MSAPTLQNYGPDNIDELLTTSMTNLLPGIKDNVFNANPALKLLKQKGKVMRRGGAAHSHGILYGSNSTAGSYQRYDLLNTTPQDGLTRDQWDWAQYAVSISVDGFTERVANTGTAKLVDIVEEKKYQAEEALSLKLEQHIFAASPGSKDIRSLPVIILGSGTEGDINGTTNTWWESLVTASGSFVAQGRSDLTTAYNTLSMRNPSGNVEAILSDQNSLEYYESSLTPQMRFTSTSGVDAGLSNLVFKDVPWVWSPQATSGVIYLLNFKALEFVISSNTDFIMTDFIKPSNQDARTAQILLACSLATGVRRKLGKLTGVTA